MNANTADRVMRNVIEIVKKALIESGHDGLEETDDDIEEMNTDSKS